ncbi:uncharacterized protein LOC111034545 [Myzus persicae]|uniref:uncharacterized protein LOC111034545 n=1 Tax=Myzus persicae TaxID=13164 RepID=UPI000B932D69|nr:uncharacterized protein LOC111034545 [Myzus persicae]
MISFGIMTTLLVALACLVHYDLLGLFLDHPYARRIVYIHNGQHQHQPRFEFDHIWIPRPGTDPSTLHFLPLPVTVQDAGGKGEGYWTDSDDDVDDAHNNRSTIDGRLSRQDAHQQEPAPDTVVDGVPITTTTEVPDDRDDNNNQNYNSDDDDYVAPGHEWDDDVF